MKVVINKCYGGFGISTKALMLLIERNADCIEKIPIMHYYGGGETNKDFPCYDSKWKEKFEKDFSGNKTEDLGDGFYVFGFCETITDKEFIYGLENIHRNNELRTNNYLIRVIEELGKEANGPHAELEIVEIPDDIEWEIDEYDGIESIEEAHRSWS